MKRAKSHDVSAIKNFADPAHNVRIFGIQHGMKVADFGAGSGAYTFAIAQLLEGSGTVYSIDVQKDLLRRIKTEAHKRGLANVEIIWGDVEVPGSSKLHEHTMDVVLLSNILFQVPDKKTPLQEALRIVKKTGKVVIIDWSDSFGGLGPHKDDVFTQTAAKALASAAGFTCTEEFDAGGHHYGLIFSPSQSHAVRVRTKV